MSTESNARVLKFSQAVDEAIVRYRDADRSPRWEWLIENGLMFAPPLPVLIIAKPKGNK